MLKKQQDMTEHEKCLTNGTYERARESGTEQNYDMIDGCVNNVPKKPRRIGGRWSVLDRLHISGHSGNRKTRPNNSSRREAVKLKIRYDAEWWFHNKEPPLFLCGKRRCLDIFENHEYNNNRTENIKH